MVCEHQRTVPYRALLHAFDLAQRAPEAGQFADPRTSRVSPSTIRADPESVAPEFPSPNASRCTASRQVDGDSATNAPTASEIRTSVFIVRLFRRRLIGSSLTYPCPRSLQPAGRLSRFCSMSRRRRHAQRLCRPVRSPETRFCIPNCGSCRRRAPFASRGRPPSAAREDLLALRIDVPVEGYGLDAQCRQGCVAVRHCGHPTPPGSLQQSRFPPTLLPVLVLAKFCGTLGVSRLASRRRHDCRPKLSPALRERLDALLDTGDDVRFTVLNRIAEDRFAEISVAVPADMYQEGDTWYRDMRAPGFDGERSPNSDNSVQWLAERIIADERFAEATVKFWWPAIMGSEIAVPPEDAGDAVEVSCPCSHA